MNQSEDIKELITALAKAQGKMKPAVFNRVNPHFRNRYADFTSCMEACREPLSENGLSIMQYCEHLNEKLTLVTMLAHTSGQWIKSYFPLHPKTMDSQAIGSAMTYAKRYSLSGLIALVSDEEEDDDAETAQGRGKYNAPVNKMECHKQKKALPKTPKPKISDEQVKELSAILAECDLSYQDTIKDFLKHQYQSEKLEVLPAELFERLKNAALKNRNENFENQRRAFEDDEKTIVEKDEVTCDE